eukprot:7927134-Pyramimonas_sp.AAC.1
MAAGGPLPCDLNFARVVMPPKGDEPLGNYECTRRPDCLRPLATKNSDINIIAAVANASWT